MRLLLSETLPLRTTRMLGDYAEDLPLPEIFGDLSDAPFPLIRLSATRYFAADHVMEIAQVFIDKQITLAWERVLASDADGRTWSEAHFEAPVPVGSVVSATGKGRRDPDSGELLENPADVVERIMRIAGRDDDFSQLRAEASQFDIRVGGRLAEMKAVQDHIQDVMQSVGAIWAPGMARLYPSLADPSPILDLDKNEVENVVVRATLVDTADVTRLSYDRSDASGKPLHYIELTASPQLFDGISKEVTYAWLRTPVNAEAVGRPVTQRLAGERYDIAFDSERRSLRPCMYVRLVNHPEWPLPGANPVIMILTVEPTLGSTTVHVTGETLVGRAIVTVTAHSIALPDTIQAGLDVSVRDGVATFTATDEDGKPLAGARISIDGGEAKTTDAQGHASFALKFGSEGKLHEVAFEAPGFAPLTIEVLL